MAKLILNLKNGMNVEGEPVRQFSATDTNIELIVLSDQSTRAFLIEEIACVILEGVPPWVSSREPTSVEEIQTTTGLVFNVAIYDGKKKPTGFYGVVQDVPPPGKTVFFVHTGVNHHHKERTLGDILEKNGAITPELMNKVLKQQQVLRNKRMGEIIADTTNVSHEIIENTISQSGVSRDGLNNGRVGDILINEGLVSRQQVEQAFEKQKSGKKMRVGEMLIEQGLITEDQLLEALAEKFQMRFLDLTHIAVSKMAMAALPEGLVTRLQVFPVEIKGNWLVVATSKPTDPAIGDDLRFSTNFKIDLVVATSSQIAAAIDLHYNKKDSIDTIIEDMIIGEDVVIDDDAEGSQFIEPDSKIISLINQLLIGAYKLGASDIHIEPGIGKQPVQIRYRIDGECQIAHQVAATFKNAIISRIKIISNLDISERRKPQSGKITLRYENRKLEFRVEITPTVGGQEDAVLRLLSSSKPLPLDHMGFYPRSLERLEAVLAKPYGLILCVGPTGSGKTTTLHSALGSINKPNRKIWTAEDPVEITQAGLRQVQVNAKIGFTFAEAMRSFLRADPDVIMIGEMRDVETAHIAIEASLTGHQVFSTLHTNNAPETVIRLIDMGMDPFNFADAMLGIVAQRLARKLCDKCKVFKRPSREEYDDIVEEFYHDATEKTDITLPGYIDTVFMAPKGCDACNGTGYKGRLALHEVMIGTPAVKRAIKNGTNVDVLKELAISEGMLTLKMDGIIKIFNGLTNMDQILKVCI